MPELSVIIPVYNVEKYLRECLDSVVNQTFKDIEIILIDDGSTDKSLDICKEYAQKDNRIKIIRQENKGLSAARNTGLNAANGEYIAFVDSDDYIDTTAYEIALAHINEADIVFFGIENFGEKLSDPAQEDYCKLKYEGKVLPDNEIRRSSNCFAWNKIFKKSIIDKYSIRFADGFKYEDAGFYWKYILNANSAYYINQNFYKYRRRSASIMAETFTKGTYALDHLHVINDLYEFLQKQKLYEENKEIFKTIFKDYFLTTYGYYPKKNEVIELGTKYAQKFFSKQEKNCTLIQSLIDKKYDKLFYPDYSFNEQIFSLKNAIQEPGSSYKIKILCILGMKFEIKKQAKQKKELTDAA